MIIPLRGVEKLCEDIQRRTQGSGEMTEPSFRVLANLHENDNEMFGLWRLPVSWSSA